MRCTAQAEWGASGLPETGPPNTGGEPLGQSARSFYCLLGHLYAAARQELVHMASSLEVSASLPTMSPPHNPVSACPLVLQWHVVLLLCFLALFTKAELILDFMIVIGSPPFMLGCLLFLAG